MRKKTAILLISFLGAVALASSIVAVTSSRKAQRLEYYARASSEHAFEELVASMSELSNDLEKSLYVSDPQLQSALCTQVYGRTVAAQMAMGMLPYEAHSLEQTAGFVSRVGDYASVLSKTVSGNDGYTQEELQNLQSLSETASELSRSLQELRLQLSNGTMQMDTALLENSIEPGTEEAVSLSSSIADIENEFPELPTLIYDGPFSDGIRTDAPRLLEGEETVSEEKARSAAARVLSVAESDVKSLGECGGDIPCWCFTAKVYGSDYSVYVTKQGGYVLSVLCARTPGQTSYSVDDGLAMAERFVESMGLENMRRSYHIVQNGVLTVNFEYEQDGVLCYPDLVKVGIALDNGTLMSYDASGYISAHRQRELPEAQISEEEARAILGDPLSVDSTNLTVIPMEGGEEKLCYEFVCSGGEHRCIVYINAVSGAEERILLLLEDENGSLTI